MFNKGWTKKQTEEYFEQSWKDMIKKRTTPSQEMIDLINKFPKEGVVSKHQTELKTFIKTEDTIQLTFKGLGILCSKNALKFKRNREYIKDYIKQFPKDSDYIEFYTEEELDNFIKTLSDYEK